MATPGHIVISSNYERRSPLPLDPSLIRDDIADRDAIPSYQRYPNMEITLLNTNETYKLIVGTSSADPMDNNNWVQQYNNESYWLESAGVYGYILNPVPGVKELFLQEDGGGLTMLTIRNNNDVDNYVGAVLQLKGSGADFTNNLYFGKYGESFYIPSWAGNAVLATDRNLVFGAIGDTSYIMFQAGGGYNTPIDVLQLQHNGRLQSQVVDYENLVTGDNDFTNKKYVDNLASGITLAIEWEFSDIIVDADPGTGKFQFNASTMVATDTIYVNDYSTSGVDMSTIISNLEIGDVLYLQNRTDSSVAGLFTIAALPVDDVGYWKIPVTYESDSGNQFVDGVQSVWIISSGTSTAVVDEKVKSTAADDTAGYLYNKLIEGVGVTIDLQNPGLTETLLISTPQAHDQNTDYQIVYEETATVSFYLGGNSGAYVLRTQDNRVNIDFDANATAYFDVIQVIANGFYHLNYITIFEGATQIYASAISAQVIDALSGLDYGYKLTHPVLLTNGVSYRFEFMHDGPANSTIPSSLTPKGNYIEGGTFTFVPNYVITYTDETGTPITRTDVAIINTLRSSNEAGIIVDTGNIVAYGNGFTYNGYQVYHEGNLPIGLTQPDIYQLYQPDKTNPFVYTDNSGTLHIDGNIVQNGSAYETHAEQIYTKKDLIITRDGAVAGLAAGEYSGIQAHLYDGVTDGQLVFDNGGVARVGDLGNLQPLATREETPTDQYYAKWVAANSRFETVDLNAIYLGIGAKAADSDLLDGLNSSSFARAFGRTTADYDTLMTTGMYGTGPSNPNSPGNSYISLITATNSDTGLQIAGGYNSGQLFFRGWASSGSTFYAWNKIWHENNGGAGSGLDADLLDGVEGNNYSSRSVGTFTTGAAGWYRIAYGKSNGAHNAGVFTIRLSVSGSHGSLVFAATATYGQSQSLSLLSSAPYSLGIKNIRLLEGGTYDQPFIELETNVTGATITIYITDAIGWTADTVSTPGSIPAGYAATTLEATVGMNVSALKVLNNTVWHSGNDGAGSGLDADLLDGFTSSTSGTANTIALRNSSGNITANNLLIPSNNAYGVYFRSSAAYRIFMSTVAASGITEALSGSDYNMYFEMSSANRGFVWYNTTVSANPLMQNLNGDLYIQAKYRRNVTTQGYLSGSYNASGGVTDTGPIYVMGTSYFPAATTLGNMYGIGYSYGGNAFLNATDLGTAPGSRWGMYVAADGNARVFLDATLGRVYAKSYHYGADFILHSDRRLKNSISPLTVGVDGLLSKKYKRNDEKYWQYGFIAQDMLKTHPELVRGSEETNYTVSYNSIIALTVRDLQIEKTKNIKLTAKTQQLERRVETLERRLKDIEKILL